MQLPPVCMARHLPATTVNNRHKVLQIAERGLLAGNQGELAVITAQHSERRCLISASTYYCRDTSNLKWPGRRHLDPLSADGNDLPVKHPSAPCAWRQSYADFRRVVLLRVELATPAEIKVAGSIVYIASILAFAAQMGLLGDKINEPNAQRWFSTNSLEKANVAVACLCISALGVQGGLYATSLHRTHGKQWSRRKHVLSLLAFCKLVVMFLSSTFYLAANAYLLDRTCAWFDSFITWAGFVRASCLNALFCIFLVEARNTNPWKRPPDKTATISLATPGVNGDIPAGKPVDHDASKSTHPLDEYDEAADEHAHPQPQVQLLLDAPWWLHWPELLFAAVLELYLLAAQVVQQVTNNNNSARAALRSIPAPECLYHPYNCSSTKLLNILVYTSQGIVLLYFVLYCLFMYRGFQHLWHNPYSANKLSNIAVRLQMRQTLPAFLVTQVCLALSWFVAPGSCASLFTTLLGILPQQLVLSALVASGAFYFQPKLPDSRHPFPQDWLQEFAWSEASLEATKAERDVRGAEATAAQGPDLGEAVSKIRDAIGGAIIKTATLGMGAVEAQVAAALAAEPMFCVETAIKALFWSHLAYNFPPKRPLIVEELPHAMGMWGLEEVEEIIEPSVDSKALLTWNRQMLVLVFRGTASIANALTDLQAWRAPHPPKRGYYFLCQQPMVHHGFLKAWRAGGFNARVLGRIRELIGSGKVDAASCRVLVTGHSLGGAMATLAAYDVQKEFGFARLACYTVGAPRTGNHSFAREYNKVVPNTWQVTNDQDAVPRTGKLITMYKRPGNRVIINLLGDLIVRPSSLETALRNRPGGGKLKDHLLAAYQRSFAAILASQWGDKYQDGGRKGVWEIVRNKHVLYILQQVSFRELVLQAVRLGHVQLGKEGKPKTEAGQAVELAEDVGVGLAEGAADILGTILPFVPQPGQIRATAVAKAEEQAGQETV
ncbi:hypothetical protein WJX72_002401 [[Myrmecia] bisecta]|uniref:Fungal lipase-type domain-containing protein n=1 Tax=[Myrmecia] bisecta TaxID=41462 RepID=A0AAW1R5G6_9CHLO